MSVLAASQLRVFLSVFPKEHDIVEIRHVLISSDQCAIPVGTLGFQFCEVFLALKPISAPLKQICKKGL